MDINSNRNENYSVVNVSGKIDAVTCSELEESLQNLIDEGDSRIILDMSGCNYISSAGLRVLLSITKKLYGSGAFALCNLNEGVSEILEMAGFSAFMNIFKDFESAESEIGKS